MNEAISRRKLLFLAGLAASIVVPTTVLIASNAEAQQTEQTPCWADCSKGEKEKEKEEGDLKLRSGPSDKATEGTVVIGGIKTEG